MKRTPGEKKTRSLEKHGLNRKDDTLGVRLLLTLEKHGLNQAEFAAWMEMSPATVCRYINGERQPSVKTLRKMAELLDISAEWLMGAGPGDPKAGDGA